MDDPIFDAMLKTALEEALRLDLEEAPAAPPPSRRQKRRMRRLLSGGEAERPGLARPKLPGRWLAAVIAAALLTGAAAAGFALGSGERFRQMFEDRHLNKDYGSAANTEQLLDMGVEMGATVESGGVRFEMLDAIFDGQTVMISVRMSVLDPELLEKLEKSDGTLLIVDSSVSSENGEEAGSLRCDLRSWEEAEDLEEGQYDLILSASDESLSEGGRYSLRLGDLVLFPKDWGLGDVLREGPWTLSVVLRPTETVRLEPDRVCRVNGVDCVLESIALSPLTMRLSLRCLEDERQARRLPYIPYKDLEIHMKNGEVIDGQGCSGKVGAGGRQINARLDFPMPLDLEQVEYIHLCGLDIYLEE